MSITGRLLLLLLLPVCSNSHAVDIRQTHDLLSSRLISLFAQTDAVSALEVWFEAEMSLVDEGIPNCDYHDHMLLNAYTSTYGTAVLTSLAERTSAQRARTLGRYYSALKDYPASMSNYWLAYRSGSSPV